MGETRGKGARALQVGGRSPPNTPLAVPSGRRPCGEAAGSARAPGGAHGQRPSRAPAAWARPPESHRVPPAPRDRPAHDAPQAGRGQAARGLGPPRGPGRRHHPGPARPLRPPRRRRGRRCATAAFLSRRRRRRHSPAWPAASAARPPARSLLERRAPRPESRPAAQVWLRACVRACARPCVRARARASVCPLVASLSAEVWLRARASIRVCACPRVRACVRPSVYPPRLELRCAALRAPRTPRPSPLCGPLGEALIGGAGPENVAPPWPPTTPAPRNSGESGKEPFCNLTPFFWGGTTSPPSFPPQASHPRATPPQESVCKGGHGSHSQPGSAGLASPPNSLPQI